MVPYEIWIALADYIVHSGDMPSKSVNGDANGREAGNQTDDIERAKGKLKMNEQLHMHMFPAAIFTYAERERERESLCGSGPLCVSFVSRHASILSMSFHYSADVTRGLVCRQSSQ